MWRLTTTALHLDSTYRESVDTGASMSLVVRLTATALHRDSTYRESVDTVAHPSL